MQFKTASKDDLDSVRQVPSEQLRILWIDDFYDGPLAGVAEVDGVRFRFDMIGRESLGAERQPRRYWLICLTSEQLQDEVH